MLHYIVQVMSIIALFVGSIEIIKFSISMISWMFRKRHITASTNQLVSELNDIQKLVIDQNIETGFQRLKLLSVSEIKKYYKNCGFIHSVEKSDDQSGDRNHVLNSIIDKLHQAGIIDTNVKAELRMYI